MQGLDQFFKIHNASFDADVETIELPGQVLFRILFSDKRNALVICRALNEENKKFWTSIPEGRLAEAQTIGPLIEAYYRNKK